MVLTAQIISSPMACTEKEGDIGKIHQKHNGKEAVWAVHG